MAIKRIKKTPAVQTPTDKAQALWLATLGAVSVAQKRGGAIVSGLIAEGQGFQARAQKLAQQVSTATTAKVHDAIAPFRASFKRNTKKVGAVVQSGLAKALGTVGIPSKRDIDELTQRVAALSKQLKVKTAR
jgi:poly(hydroxyalkanoate) granule-associated protein